MNDVDAKNRETLRQGPPLDLPMTAMDVLEGQWGADLTNKDLEDEAMCERHDELMDKRRAGQG